MSRRTEPRAAEHRVHRGDALDHAPLGVFPGGANPVVQILRGRGIGYDPRTVGAPRDPEAGIAGQRLRGDGGAMLQELAATLQLAHHVNSHWGPPLPMGRLASSRKSAPLDCVGSRGGRQGAGDSSVKLMETRQTRITGIAISCYSVVSFDLHRIIPAPTEHVAHERLADPGT